MKALIKGLIIGAALSTTVLAQGDRYVSGSVDCLQWSQPDASVTAATAIKVRIKVDAAAPIAIAQTCDGTASPFTCRVTLPASALSVGPHTVLLDGQRTINGVLGPVESIGSYSYTIDPVIPPIPAGLNFRLIKGT